LYQWIVLSPAVELCVAHLEVPLLGEQRKYKLELAVGGSFHNKTMNSVHYEACKQINERLYLAKGFVARNRKTREMVAVKGVDYEDKLHALTDLWNEERIQFTRHHFAVQEPIDVSVVLHWNMVGSVDEAVTLALAGFGTEQSKAGDNTMHIGGEIWAGMNGVRADFRVEDAGTAANSSAFVPRDLVSSAAARHVVCVW
jgi:hypothetical protein